MEIKAQLENQNKSKFQSENENKIPIRKGK